MPVLVESLTYSEVNELIRLIDKELSFLEDNLYRHEHSGDRYGEVRSHRDQIDALKAIKGKLTA